MIQRMCHGFFLLLLLACTEPSTVTFQEVSFSEETMPQCEASTCPEISLQYLKAKGPGELTTQINKEVEAVLINALHIGDPDQPITATQITEAAEEFIATYHKHVAEFPDMPAAYEVDVTLSERFQNDQFVSLECNVYTYTGGAHGYGSTSFLLFDKERASSIRFREVVANWPAFETYAETALREAYDIPTEGSINANGFWFEKDQFYIPESIGFTSEGVVLIYNPYEIASYAEGAIELMLPWDEVEPYLKAAAL